MITKYRYWILSLALCLTTSAWGGTFGKAVSIGGHAVDLALDESRGLLYVANFTANRIEVISTANNTVVRSINVASQPSSLAISPDSKYLVIAHYGNNTAPVPATNALTVINLETGDRQTVALGAPPFGVSFGASSAAFVATAGGFYLFDPVTGTTQLIENIDGIKSKAIPQPSNTLPLTITSASLNTSGDGSKIFGITDSLLFSYNVYTGELAINTYTSTPTQGPRVVSVNNDASVWIGGWSMNEGTPSLLGIFGMISEFPGPTGELDIGSHAIDTFRGLVYAQIPSVKSVAGTRPPPILQILDADNLAVRDRFNLPENLAGKSLISGDNSTMYSISESGVVVMPIGALDQVRRIVVGQEDVVFRGSFCSKQTSTQEIVLNDPSGGNSDFSITSSNPGVKILPASGTTPARIRISVDPASFLTQKGTTAVQLTITSNQAVNIPPPVRVLVNNREPDQVGTFVNVPGKLVDILADPDRNRFFILRQDKNVVLVFDANTNTQIATLRTGNTPTQMAITFDRKNLLVGGNDTQLLYVYDLDTLKALDPVRMPGGHYPKSVASAGGAILVANRVAGPVHSIDRVDLSTRTATQLPTLGVFKNDININTVLVASQNGSSIMAAEADGNVLLYNSNADTFTISRHDFAALSGAYAASNYDQFVIGNNFLNSSLVPGSPLDTAGTPSSGFAFIDQVALRTTAPDTASAGLIQRLDLQTQTSKTSRLIEAPVLSDPTVVFTRTLAPFARKNMIVALTVSGFTVLPWNYDAATAAPQVTRVVNSADFTEGVAPGGLITITGSGLSSVTQAFTGTTSNLGDSCIQINGAPLPILYVSPTQINAQLPTGSVAPVTLRIATPGGIVDNYPINLEVTAPAIFRVNVPGVDDAIPAIVRAENNQLVTPSNPVHRGDVITIYATGLGRTSPDISAGTPAPAALASVVIPPSATIGGTAVQVLFAGLAPGQIGVYQINVKVFNNVPLGLSLPFVLTQGGNSASASVRVVQ